MRSLPEKLTARQKKFVNEWKALGIGPESTDFWEVWDSENLESPVSLAESRETIIREAETVLQSLYYPNSIGEVSCKNCKRKFATNYRYNKHCSEDCLRQSLEAMGLRWDPDKPAEERWHGEPPGTITPQTLFHLKLWAEAIRFEYQEPLPLPAIALPPMMMEISRMQAKSILSDLDLPDIDL